MTNCINLPRKLFLVVDVANRQQVIFGFLICLLNHINKPLWALRINVHHICSHAFKHTHKLFNVNAFLLPNYLLQVTVYILMQPIFISHNRIVLVKFTFHYHPKNLLIIRQIILLIVLWDKLCYRLPHWVYSVIQVLIYRPDDWIEHFLLSRCLLLFTFWRLVSILHSQHHVVRKHQYLLQDCSIFLQVKQSLYLVLYILYRQSLLLIDIHSRLFIQLYQLINSSLKSNMHCDEQLLLEP